MTVYSASITSASIMSWLGLCQPALALGPGSIISPSSTSGSATRAVQLLPAPVRAERAKSLANWLLDRPDLSHVDSALAEALAWAPRAAATASLASSDPAVARPI